MHEELIFNEGSSLERIIFLINYHNEMTIDAIKERLCIEENLLGRMIGFLVDAKMIEPRRGKLRLTKFMRQFLES